MLTQILWSLALHAPQWTHRSVSLHAAQHRSGVSLVESSETLDRQALRVAFTTFDADGNGEITMAELDNAMTSSGYYLLEDELASIMGDDTIDFDQFCTFAEEHPQQNYAEAMLRSAIRRTFSEALPPSSADAPPTSATKGNEGFVVFFDLFKDVSAAFDRFDANSDGTITSAEMGEVLHSLGHEPLEKDLAAMVAAYDDNGNGTIDFDEFCSLVSADSP